MNVVRTGVPEGPPLGPEGQTLGAVGDTSARHPVTKRRLNIVLVDVFPGHIIKQNLEKYRLFQLLL